MRSATQSIARCRFVLPLRRAGKESLNSASRFHASAFAVASAMIFAVACRYGASHESSALSAASGGAATGQNETMVATNRQMVERGRGMMVGPPLLERRTDQSTTGTPDQRTTTLPTIPG